MYLYIYIYMRLRFPQPIIICTTCGSWASCKPVKLNDPCTGPPAEHSACKAALDRVARGKHPIGDKGCLNVPLLAVCAKHQQEVMAMIDSHLAAPKRQSRAKRPFSMCLPLLNKSWGAAPSSMPRCSQMWLSPARLPGLKRFRSE